MTAGHREMYDVVGGAVGADGTRRDESFCFVQERIADHVSPQDDCLHGMDVNTLHGIVVKYHTPMLVRMPRTPLGETRVKVAHKPFSRRTAVAHRPWVQHTVVIFR